MPHDHSRAARLERQFSLASPTPRGQIDATADPELAKAGHVLDVADSAFHLVEGVVVDSTGYVHDLRVQLASGRGTVRGVLIGPTAFGLQGVRQGNTLPPGSVVLCAHRPGSDEAMVLAAIPPANVDPRDSLSDAVIPGSGVGLTVDAYLQAAFLLPVEDGDEEGLDGIGACDYSAGRPFDSLTGGEASASALTGTGWHADMFLAYLRVDEETGLFLSYPNQHARLGGHNLEITSACAERADGDDESRLWSEEGFAVDQWEAAGIRRQPSGSGSQPPFRQIAAEDVQLEKPWLYYWEPQYEDQLAFHRFWRYHGWLAGGGQKKLLLAFPPGTDGPLRYSDELVLPCLFDQHTLGSGRHLVRSARGLVLAKQLRLVAPKRLRPPLCDQKADPELTLEAELSFDPAVLPGDRPATRLAAFLDQVAYSANYEALTPFFEQDEAWYVPEETDLPEGWEDQAPDYDLLCKDQRLPAPQPVTIDLGGKYGEALFYPNSAFLALLDDGGVVLCDGWGSEIRMASGEIWQTCAGDHHVHTGRNHDVWAGGDVIHKAHHCLDLSAANGDLRIKAQKNLMLLGGNDECGGVLVESRAPSTAWTFDEDHVGTDAVVGGIVLKAKDSQVVTIARDVVSSARLHVFNAYWSDTSGSGSGAVSGSGPDLPPQFVIDVGHTGKVLTRSLGFERRAPKEGYFLDAFLIDGEYNTWKAASQTWSDRLYLGVPLGVDGFVQTSDCLMADSWILGRQHVATERSEANQDVTSRLTQAARERMQSLLETMVSASIAAEDHLASTRVDGFYDHVDNAQGDVQAAEFSFRTPSQYRTEPYLVFEPRWQQIARQAGQSLPVWQEPEVLTLAGPTRPYPGQEPWAAQTCFQKVDWRIYDQTTGNAKDRDDESYVDAEFHAGTEGYLESEYRVVVDACHSR